MPPETVTVPSATEIEKKQQIRAAMIVFMDTASKKVAARPPGTRTIVSISESQTSVEVSKGGITSYTAVRSHSARTQ